jgi:hypothetical protein
MTSPPFRPALTLAAFIRDQASWRRSQATRFPDDARNPRSAAALDELATYVEQLADTDRALRELVELDAFSDDLDRFEGGNEARRAIARWKFADDTDLMRPPDLLQDLVAITRRARRKSAPERDSKMTTQMNVTDAAGPTITWTATRLSDRILWHAVKFSDGSDLMTYCDKRLEPGGPIQEVARGAVVFPGCSTCEAALLKAPHDEPGALADPSDVDFVELDHRQFEIAAILDLCISADRESRRLDRWVDSQLLPSQDNRGAYAKPVLIEKPVRFADLLGLANTHAARLAVPLYPPIARLVDQCLDVAPDWTFHSWPPQKQAARMHQIFKDAGIGGRFVLPRWAGQDADAEDLPITGSANWHSAQHDVMVEVYGTTLNGDSLADILDPFGWNGDAESLRAYLGRQLMRTVKIRDTSTSSSGGRLIELDVA